MKFSFHIFVAAALLMTSVACKKKGCTDPTAENYSSSAKKDDGSCYYASTYAVPTTYAFTNSTGNSTVNYDGQADRINQLAEMIAYAEGGEEAVLDAQFLYDMFANTGGNGNGHFSFSSSRQLKDKCFSLDQTLIESYFDSIAAASVHFATTASNGQAGTLTSGASKYLFSANGFEYAEIIEKSVMGAVFEYQALNVYFGPDKMSADNTTAVDPANGLYYTNMQHHWDEAFGYFGVPTDFPTTPATEFWGKYCNSRNAVLDCNNIMMANFLKGRAAIVNKAYADRDVTITNIRDMWEKIAAYSALNYLTQAEGYFGTDTPKMLHVLSEAYGFIYCLRFAPDETRHMTQAEVTALLAQFGDNLWELTASDIQSIKAELDAHF